MTSRSCMRLSVALSYQVRDHYFVISNPITSARTASCIVAEFTTSCTHTITRSPIIGRFGRFWYGRLYLSVQPTPSDGKSIHQHCICDYH